jgi:hypothetical protein
MRGSSWRIIRLTTRAIRSTWVRPTFRDRRDPRRAISPLVPDEKFPFLARFRLVEIKRLFRESIQESLYPLVLDVRVELGRFESVRSLVARNAQNPRSARELSVDQVPDLAGRGRGSHPCMVPDLRPRFRLGRVRSDQWNRRKPRSDPRCGGQSPEPGNPLVRHVLGESRG